MSTIIKNSIKRGLSHIIDWDFVKKSQLLLWYAIFFEIGLFLIQWSYLGHELVNSPLLREIIWFIPTIMTINFLLVLIGRLIKPHPQYHPVYSCVVLSFYFSCLLFLHFMVGLLNLANGVVFVGTIIIVMILFPFKLVSKVLWGYAAIYLLLVYLTVTGYIDYALAFTPNALIHPRIEGIYVSLSVFYSILYSILIVGVSAVFIDVWKEKQMHRNVMRYKDPLTYLLNESGIKQIASLQLSQAQITQSELSVVTLDIDNLKRVNDEFGQASGDLALQHVAEVLRKNLRSSDMIGRLNGGTYVLILAFTSLERAEVVAEMCRLAIEQSGCVLENSSKIMIKASFGVSSTDLSTFDFDQLYAMSVDAMKNAKHNGKNQVCIADAVLEH